MNSYIISNITTTTYLSALAWSSTHHQIQVIGNHAPDNAMAPVNLDTVDGMLTYLLSTSFHLSLVHVANNSRPDQIKGVIQDLFQIQSATHGYLGPQTQQELVRLV